MKNVAVIGDSHSSMLMLAWKELKGVFPHIDLNFFTWRSNGEKSLVLRGERDEVVEAIKISDNQSNILDIEKYDAVLICGLGYDLRTVFDVYKDYRTCHMVESKYLISESCFLSAVDGNVKKAVSMKVVDLLSSMSFFDVFVMPTPRGAEYFLDHEERYNLYKACIQNGDQKYIREVFDAISQVYENKQAAVISQPDITICQDILTKKSYSNATDPVKNERMLKLKGRRDLIHMNECYGELVLREFLNFCR